MADPRYKNNVYKNTPQQKSQKQIIAKNNPLNHGWQFKYHHIDLNAPVYQLAQFRMVYVEGVGWGVQNSDVPNADTTWYQERTMREITEDIMGKCQVLWEAANPDFDNGVER